MDETMLTYLSHKLQAEMARFAEDTILGKAKDHGEYKYACGIYRGLSTANGFLVEMIEQARGGDNDDE